LENLPASSLEKYRDLIRDHIRGQHGIYALYKSGRLYYVGLAKNLRARLSSHLKDKHKGRWDRFSVYLTVESQHVRELESLLLRIVKPKGNTQSGRLTRSQNLMKTLRKEIAQRQRDELDVLTGKKAKVTRKKSARQVALRNKDSQTALGPYVKRAFWIRRTYKGTTYKARVRQDGWIWYNGYHYPTPTMLAREICGRHVNGWRFWQFQRAPGQWVDLDALRH
jgi:hypothetical protein